MAAKTYIAMNSANPTTLPPVKQPTGTSTRTMLQLLPNVTIRPIAWGASFDGAIGAANGIIELVDTYTVGATALSTYYAVADIQPYGDPNAPAQSAGASGTPLALGSSGALSGFATAGVTEGSITMTRHGDIQELSPASGYAVQWPLGREWEVPPGHFVRVRCTFATSANATIWLVFEI